MDKRARNIEIVLASPQSAGNIGSVARVLMNTGFGPGEGPPDGAAGPGGPPPEEGDEREAAGGSAANGCLSLVDPVDFHNDEAYCMACNAGELLRSAPVYPDLTGALAESGFVAGATRRGGKLRRPLFTLDEAAAQIIKHAELNKVSVVFGREDRGFVTEELPHMDILFEIPSDDAYPSYNLSHAVLIVCFRLQTLLEAGTKDEGPTIEAARRGEVIDMFVHFETVLRRLDYGDRGGEHLLKTVMKNLRRIFGRTALTEKEVNMMRGILARVEEKTVEK